MADLIERKPLYEQAVKLEAQALDYVGRLIERDGEEPSEEWRVWSAILTERTAFKHDVFDAPSAELEIVRCKDCKHCFKDGENGRYKWLYNCCDLNHNKLQCDNWFCADGERRSDECFNQ